MFIITRLLALTVVLALMSACKEKSLDTGSAGDEDPGITLTGAEALKNIALEGADFGKVEISSDSISRQITIKNLSATENMSDINLLELKEPFSFLNGTFPGTGGTCVKGLILKPNEECDIMVAIAPQMTETMLKQNVKIDFKLGKNNFAVVVKLSADVVDDLSLDATDLDFKDVQPQTKNKKMLNLINNSLFKDISELTIEAVKPNAFFMFKNADACKHIEKAKNCLLDVEFAAPKIGMVDEAYVIKYKINNEMKQEQIRLKGNVESKTNLKIQSVFGHRNVVPNKAAQIYVTVLNPEKSEAISMLELDPDLSTLKINTADSTCLKAPYSGALKARQSCYFAINAEPTKNHLPFEHSAKLKFKDSANADQEIKIALRGSFALDTNNDLANNKPIIIESTKLNTDPWAPYIRRPLHPFVDPTFDKTWSSDVWKRARPKNIKHSPWTVDVAKEPFLLRDVVLDRIIDPVTGKRYIAMYHGSRSQFLDIFKPGASALAFDKATTAYLGGGLYLTASPNEAKTYACASMAEGMGMDKAGKLKKGIYDPNQNFGIVLVVGIEEDALIKGKWQIPNAFNVPRILSYPNGVAKDKSIFFGRDTRFKNQFVFFNNVAPFMKLFNIIKMPRIFGVAYPSTDAKGTTNLSDVDGKPISDTSKLRPCKIR